MIKLATDIHRASGSCWKCFQRQRSPGSGSSVYRCVNAIGLMAEADISTLLRQGKLVLIKTGDSVISVRRVLMYYIDSIND